MKRRIGLASLLIVLSAVVAGASDAAGPAPGCTTGSRLVESTIAGVARGLKGKEYCQFRRYETLSDVDGDGRDDFIVLFNVESIGGHGNDHYDYMTVFLSGRKWQPLTVKTGGRGERDPVSVEVRGRKIALETLVYRSSDPMCCPSGKGSLVYEVQGKELKLVEEREEPAQSAAPPGQNATSAQ